MVKYYHFYMILQLLAWLVADNINFQKQHSKDFKPFFT